MRDAVSRRGGFTLIEIAISMIILGLLLAAAANSFQHAQQQSKKVVTRQHMAAVVKALSSYVETSSRLPCPADPSVPDSTPANGIGETFGWEWGVTQAMLAAQNNGKPTGTCGNVSATQPPNDTVGIVPFQTLGLPYEDVLDGWGRYFTYAVSPAFTQTTDFSQAGSTIDGNFNVHARCRTAAWVTSTGGTNPTININLPKARFCCVADNLASIPYDWPATAPSDTFLHIQYWTAPAAVDISNPPSDFSAGAMNTNYYAPLNSPSGSINDMYVNKLGGDPAGDQRPISGDPASTGNIVAPAFVLISHGPNGYGAYLADGTFNRYNDGTTTGTQEDPGGIAVGQTYLGRIFYTGPTGYSTTAANYFDDIVVWMTQDGIMAANGTSSCEYP